MAFAVGLLGFILIKVLAPGFYARQDTKTPVRIGMISMAANIVMSLAFVSHLKHVGLALAISLAAIVNAGLLYRALRSQNIYRPEPGWATYLFRVTAASLVMGGLLWWGVGDLTEWFAMATHERILRLSFYILIGMTVYVASLLALGVRPRQLLLKKVAGGTSAHDK